MHFTELAKARRAVNHFDPKAELGEPELRKIVEMAALSPSSYNLQPWSLIVVRDMDKKGALRKLAMDQPKVTEAPVVLVVLADRDGWKEGHPYLERNFREMVQAGSMKEEQHGWFIEAAAWLYGQSEAQSQAFACKNAGFFAMSLMYAAKELGFDSHPMDGFDHEGVRAEFKIPDNYWVPLLLALGRFDTSRTLYPPKWRKSYDEICVDFG